MKESHQVMSSFGPYSRLRRVALGAGAALAFAFAAAPSASAQFTITECGGAAAPGQGASFQNAAFNGFRSVFLQEPPKGCGAAANAITYRPTGSGDGLGALGARTATNPTGARHASDRWAGTDEPPNTVRRAQIEAGPVDGNDQDVTAADDGKLHVVPVAMGSVAVMVNLPTACTGFGAAELYRERPKVTLENLERAWYATQVVTWGELIPGLLPAAGCADQTVTRIVRLDSSGTTFAFKQFLYQIEPSHTLWRSLGNNTWPNGAGPNPVRQPLANGNGPLAALVGTTPGSIGYGDLATVRLATGGLQGPFTFATATFDKTFWLPLQRAEGSATYDDPQADPDGYKAGSIAKGANCATVEARNVPNTSFDDWSAVDSTLTEDGYAACTLTYNMLWDDNAVVYCNSAEEQAKARTIKDYFTRAVISPDGQGSLAGSDYSALPADLLAKATAAVGSIGWNKGGQGRPCPGAPPEPTPTPTPQPGPPGGNNTTPPPPPPSNAVTVSSSRVSGTTIRLSLQLPGAGKISIASSTKPKKGKTIRLTTKNVNVTRSGAQTVTVSLSSKAKSALRKDKKLKVTLRITYTPTGGTAKTITRTVTVKQPKKKS